MQCATSKGSGQLLELLHLQADQNLFSMVESLLNPKFSRDESFPFMPNSHIRRTIWTGFLAVLLIFEPG